MAQESETEIKMVNRGILPVIIRILDNKTKNFAKQDGKLKSDQSLLITCLDFLRKLSVFVENVEKMVLYYLQKQFFVFIFLIFSGKSKNCAKIAENYEQFDS